MSPSAPQVPCKRIAHQVLSTAIYCFVVQNCCPRPTPVLVHHKRKACGKPLGGSSRLMYVSQQGLGQVPLQHLGGKRKGVRTVNRGRDGYMPTGAGAGVRTLTVMRKRTGLMTGTDSWQQMGQAAEARENNAATGVRVPTGTPSQPRGCDSVLCSRLWLPHAEPAPSPSESRLGHGHRHFEDHRHQTGDGRKGV